MTEQKQQVPPPKNSELNKKVEPKGADKTTAKVKQKEGVAKKSWISFLFILLLAIAIAALGYFYMEQEKAIAALFSQQNQFSQQAVVNTNAFDEVRSSVQTLRTELVEANTVVAEQQLELERLNRELISARLKINTNGSNASQAWMLEESESLLRIAQQRLIVSHDVRSALALFVSSDEILKQINDPAIFAIRNILAADMAALRAVDEIDVQGMYLQLGVLAKNVGAMKIVSGSAEQLASSEQITLGRTESDSGFFDAVMGKLSEYVVVRRSDQPIQPLLTSEQEFYIKQNIQLQLEQARLALLREQEEVYRNSISEALENIERYLAEEGRKKQSLIESLKSLRDAPIIMQVPPVRNSLTALQQILPEVGE